MATLEWQVKKETFNPEKNYFEGEFVTIHRDESDEEMAYYNKMVHYSNAAVLHGIILSIVGILGASASGAILIEHVSKPWGIFAAIMFIILGLLSIPAYKINARKSAHYLRTYELYKKENNVWETCPEALEIKAYNDEQDRLAEIWRAEHPLEEKIRVCLKDPRSSVAIADLARYYAEVYLKDSASN